MDASHICDSSNSISESASAAACSCVRFVSCIPVTVATVFLRSDAAATVYFADRLYGYYSRAAFISLESLEKSTKAG